MNISYYVYGFLKFSVSSLLKAMTKKQTSITTMFQTTESKIFKIYNLMYCFKNQNKEQNLWRDATYKFSKWHIPGVLVGTMIMKY